MTTEWPESRQIQLSKILSRIGFCGCGSDRKWQTMRLLLENAESHARPFYDEAEGELFWEFSANCLDSFGLIEHGTSIGYAWLTDEGEALLAFLREFPDGNYPEWSEGDI